MRSVAPSRRGASIPELVGCMIAMAGGLAIGASYLGVDLKGVCASALKSADIAAPTWLSDTEQAMEVAGGKRGGDSIAAAILPADEKEPGDWAADAGQTPSAPQIAPPAERMTVESARERRRDSLGYLIPLTDEQAAVLTRAYWDDLLAIIAVEEESRRACIDDACNLQLFEYLGSRRVAHAAAAQSIAELRADGVDPHVMGFSDSVRSWHEEGEDLFGRAIDLLTDAPTAQLTGPFAQSWQSAATQHRMEERLLVEKRAAVQTFLDHRLSDVPAPTATTANGSE